MAPSRPKYSGSKRHLVIGFDLGTTFSGISYAIQDPGKEVIIQSVKRFPGQEKGDAAIPSVIYYSKDGKVAAVGAEEPSEDAYDEKGVYPWKMEWFKMLLRPKGIQVMHDNVPEPKLPPNKGIENIYSDFYRYLFHCTKLYISQTNPAGEIFWNSIDEDDMTFVLAHPNGWGGAQQAVMRRAMVKAGLVPDGDKSFERVNFVSEGEASLHFCLADGAVSDEIEPESTVMVIDAGGGTIDISSYEFVSVSPIEVKEAAPSVCLFEGSVIVRQRAERHIRAKLANSKKFGKSEYIGAIANAFDNTAKKRFRGGGDSHVVFSNMVSDTDKNVDIRGGKIKLTEVEMAGFFDPGINAINKAIDDHRHALEPRVFKTFFLVGGFASNEYLFKKVKDHLADDNLVLLRPDCESKKAAAEGAVSFRLDHLVSARTAKLTYGTRCAVPFIPFIPSHRERAQQVVPDITGGLMLCGAFADVLTKASAFGTPVSETTEFRNPFSSQGFSRKETVDMQIIAYRGSGDPPLFIDEDEESFSTLFEVSADLKDAPAQIAFGPMGRFVSQEVELVFSFGLTELKAQLAWKDKNGAEQRTPARPIFEDDFVYQGAVTVAGPSRTKT
ncbi:hypothetical protein K488DRAFT_87114 [Vararia minispora EC-137]|uniref:Uncharacterized protein n=1 Tax=Vararia minispora EC-137 TaxID=1314806 RepID=A0ACB8QHF4_9AGAM|nr:hypothetical protein K488DRAFT_87114 [Vararia minispora EC-137]